MAESERFTPEAVKKFLTRIEVVATGGREKRWRCTFERRGYHPVTFDVFSEDAAGAVHLAASLYATELSGEAG